MSPQLLLKHSPLSDIYRHFPVQFVEVEGWQMAAHFGLLERERQQLDTGAVLADWSHISKVAFSGRAIANGIEGLISADELGAIAPLSSRAEAAHVLCRLTPNDLLLLCQPGQEAGWLDSAIQSPVSVINQTGAMGCFALAGPRRDEVLERSTALDLRRDRVGIGAVVQTTVHTIRCTLYRTKTLDILVHPRSLSESLFTALIDVGISAGLMPTGLEVLPVRFEG
ncbi:MAG: hypothetical protein WBA57_24410 [Elainellaceae cyanobacterium]